MSLDDDLADLDRLSLGDMADAARLEAERRGHRVGAWIEGRDQNGMNWIASCLVCGASVIAAFDHRGYATTSGSTQRATCQNVLKRKAKR
jgi:hypothetical protein